MLIYKVGDHLTPAPLLKERGYIFSQEGTGSLFNAFLASTTMVNTFFQEGTGSLPISSGSSIFSDFILLPPSVVEYNLDQKAENNHRYQ